MKKLVIGLMVATGCAWAHAQSKEWRFYGHLGTGFGGDTIAEGTYINTGGAWSVKTGMGLEYKLGFDYRVAPRVTLQTSFGNQRSTTYATNGEISMNTNSLEFMGFYDLTPSVRLGGGVRTLTMAEVKASGVASGFQAAGRYDSTPGAVVELQYVLDATERKDGSGPGQFGISVRYVDERLTQSGVNGPSKNGSYTGLGLFLYF